LFIFSAVPYFLLYIYKASNVKNRVCCPARRRFIFIFNCTYIKQATSKIEYVVPRGAEGSVHTVCFEAYESHGTPFQKLITFFFFGSVHTVCFEAYESHGTHVQKTKSIIYIS